MNCKNCQNQFEGNYCPNCGQIREANNRLRFLPIVQRFLDDTFDLNHGFFFTVWQLLLNPGRVGSNYIGGKRQRYTSPLRFLIIMVALQALIDFLSDSNRLIKEFEMVFNPLISSRLNDSITYYNYVLGTEYALYIGIASIAIFPIAFNIFFRRLNYNYTELLVISFYYFGIAQFLSTITVFLLRHLFGVYISGEVSTILIIGALIWTFMSFFIQINPVARIIRILGALAIVVLIRVYLLPFILAIFFPVSIDKFL